MNIGDELAKLQELHRSGALTDEEFATAKASMLASNAPPNTGVGDLKTRERLAKVERENALLRLDREWELESHQYMESTEGGMTPPSHVGSIIIVSLFGGLGLFLGVATRKENDLGVTGPPLLLTDWTR